MLNVFWEIIGNVKNGTTTKIWRLIVTSALIILYTCGISFATWTYRDCHDLRLHMAAYVTRDEFDKKCREMRTEMVESVIRIEKSVDEIKTSNEALKTLLINKYLNGVKGNARAPK